MAEDQVMPLPRSRPVEQDVASAGVLDFLDAAATADLELHSLMVLRRGHVVAEGWWHPYAPGQANLLYSLSKSFTSAAAGIAAQEGLFDLDDELSAHLPEFVPADVDDRSRRITVRHALMMATGHEHDLMYAAVREGGDWLNTLFRHPPEREPGTLFCYNQLASHAVARIIQRRAGMRLIDYLQPRLFAPLGITEQLGLTDPMGHDWGSHGFALSTESIAAFGQLLLQRGAWDGRRLIPADWVDLATTLQMPNDAAHRSTDDGDQPADWVQGYGFHFWRSRHGYRGDGAFGQFCIVLPERDAVIVMTALTEQMAEQLDLVWSHLLPALGTPPTPERDGELAERLQALAISTPRTDGVGGDASFVRAASPAPPGMTPAAPQLRQIDLHQDAPEVATLALQVGDRSHRLPVGIGQWMPGEWPARTPVPFSSAGGWDGGVFVAQLRMIQTPHVMLLTLDPGTSSFTANWSQAWIGHGNDPAAYAHRRPGPRGDRG